MKLRHGGSKLCSATGCPISSATRPACAPRDTRIPEQLQVRPGTPGEDGVILQCQEIDSPAGEGCAVCWGRSSVSGQLLCDSLAAVGPVISLCGSQPCSRVTQNSQLLTGCTQPFGVTILDPVSPLLRVREPGWPGSTV